MKGIVLQNPHAIYGLLLALPIVLLYLRKVPRSRQPVATAMLWREVIGARRPRERWRGSVSLIVQLVILVLLVAAMADVRWQGSADQLSASSSERSGRGSISLNSPHPGPLPKGERERLLTSPSPLTPVLSDERGENDIIGLPITGDSSADNPPAVPWAVTVLGALAIGLLTIEWCLYHRCWTT